MGLYDRDYYRDSYSESRGLHLRAPRSITATLIVICAALYLIDALFNGKAMPIQGFLALHYTDIAKPWLWWRFLTYGFVHAYSPEHIIMNMLQLGFLGGIVERTYGGREYLRVYLVMLVASAMIWVAGNLLMQHLMHKPAKYFELVGASGAISGVVMLFVLNYPNRELMLFPIPIPIKAWVLGVLLIAANVFGSTSKGDNVAYGAHLAGIFFAWLYFYNRWNLGRMFSWFAALPRRWVQPRLRLHQPGDEDDKEEPRELGAEVDRILEKISHQGETSLTRQERRTLEQASREFQRRRK